MTYVDPGNPLEIAALLREHFRTTYGGPATAVGRAPGRVNLIGEHTDYNAGLCLPMALPHATYAAVAPRDDDVVRIATRQGASPWEGTLSAVGPGSVTGWASYVAGVLWALREARYDLPGLDVLVHGTVPLGAGLSSSAALECSVAVAVADVIGVELTDDVRRQLITACMRAESEVAGAPTGGMDQTVSMLASPDAALLIDFEDHTTRDVPLPLDAAGLVLLVTDTRVSHELVDGGYAARRADCEAAVAELGLVSLRHATLEQVAELGDERVSRRARHIVTEIERVRLAETAIMAGDWKTTGALFGESHASMRDDFEISCAELDVAVTTAVEAGALGARMTGGGFGGSSIALVPEERLEDAVRAIDAAYVAAGFRTPAHLRGEPSPAAGVL